MFDATDRSKLEEMLGYERYILKACKVAIRQSRVHCSPTTIVIHDEGPNQICLHFEDTIGDTGADMTHRMSTDLRRSVQVARHGLRNIDLVEKKIETRFAEIVRYRQTLDMKRYPH